MVVSTAPGSGSLKLGQPVPLSNFVLETNSGWPQPAQENEPARFSSSSAQLPRRSVPCSRMMWYCSGVSSLRHSASVRVTGYVLVSIRTSGVVMAGLVRAIHAFISFVKVRARMPGTRPGMTDKDVLDCSIQQLDRDAFRRLDEADSHPRPHRGRLAGEFDALGLEIGCDRVDAADRKPEMIEAAIGDRRRRVGAVTVRHRRDEDVGAAELQIDARLALLHGADDLGAEHFLEPLRHRLRIGRAQVNVIPGEFGHGALPVAAA